MESVSAARPPRHSDDLSGEAAPISAGTDMPRARVLLADDHAEIRQQLQLLLEPVFEVIACVDDGYALLTAAETLTPDVIVTDIAMPNLGGIAAASELLRKNPDARIVFVTIYNSAALVQQTLAAGAFGYVLKLTAGDDLVPAIHAALRREQYISQLVGGGAR